jgi:hypothetical protein
MRSELHESIREGNQYLARGTAPREAGTADRAPIATPAVLWLETADSVFKWYGVMLRLAFGLGRMDGRGEAQRLIAPSAPVKSEESSCTSAPPPEESSRTATLYSLGRMDGRGEAQGLIASPALGPLTPAESSSIAVSHSLRTPPVTLRPKRRKTASRDKNAARSAKKNRARSSKMSSIKRSHRRAA